MLFLERAWSDSRRKALLYTMRNVHTHMSELRRIFLEQKTLFEFYDVGDSWHQRVYGEKKSLSINQLNINAAYGIEIMKK